MDYPQQFGFPELRILTSGQKSWILNTVRQHSNRNLGAERLRNLMQTLFYSEYSFDADMQEFDGIIEGLTSEEFAFSGGPPNLAAPSSASQTPITAPNASPPQNFVLDHPAVRDTEGIGSQLPYESSYLEQQSHLQHTPNANGYLPVNHLNQASNSFSAFTVSRDDSYNFNPNPAFPSSVAFGASAPDLSVLGVNSSNPTPIILGTTPIIQSASTTNYAVSAPTPAAYMSSTPANQVLSSNQLPSTSAGASTNTPQPIANPARSNEIPWPDPQITASRKQNRFLTNQRSAQHLWEKRRVKRYFDYMRLALRAQKADQNLVDAVHKTYNVTKWVELPETEQDIWKKIAEHYRDCEKDFMFITPKFKKQMTKDELADAHEDIWKAWNYPCETIVFFPGKDIHFVSIDREDDVPSLENWLQKYDPEFLVQLRARLGVYAELHWTHALATPADERPSPGDELPRGFTKTARSGFRIFDKLREDLSSEKGRQLFKAMVWERWLYMGYTGHVKWQKILEYMQLDVIPWVPEENRRALIGDKLNKNDLKAWFDLFARQQEGEIPWYDGMLFKPAPGRVLRDEVRAAFGEPEELEFDDIKLMEAPSGSGGIQSIETPPIPTATPKNPLLSNSTHSHHPFALDSDIAASVPTLELEPVTAPAPPPVSASTPPPLAPSDTSICIPTSTTTGLSKISAPETIPTALSVSPPSPPPLSPPVTPTSLAPSRSNSPATGTEQLAGVTELGGAADDSPPAPIGVDASTGSVNADGTQTPAADKQLQERQPTPSNPHIQTGKVAKGGKSKNATPKPTPAAASSAGKKKGTTVTPSTREEIPTAPSKGTRSKRKATEALCEAEADDALVNTPANAPDPKRRRSARNAKGNLGS